MTIGTETRATGSEAVAAKEPSGTATSAEAKSIILFSDGTGNSSAKLFKTNVWRMYEAVDLGPPAEGKRDQISYYDDGVGTSSFKPLAVLGGAFGWGLQRNVLDIYRYACRNYREGDDIYAFGFSRGAFTARLVVALIASEGLVRSDERSRARPEEPTAAYRIFRAAFLPRRLQWPTNLVRGVRGRITGWRGSPSQAHEPYDSARNFQPNIRFVGVWDTVAAYGGPITEITRAIDNWIFPLSMPDYQLERARPVRAPRPGASTTSATRSTRCSGTRCTSRADRAKKVDAGPAGAGLVHRHARRCGRRLSGRKPQLRLAAVDDGGGRAAPGCAR